MRASGRAALQGAEIGFHAVHVEHQARRGRLLLSKESGDLRGHRTGPPLAGRPPEQGDGRELTKRSNEPATKRLPERLTSLRNHEGQRHVRCCVGADIGPLPPRRKTGISINPQRKCRQRRHPTPAVRAFSAARMTDSESGRQESTLDTRAIDGTARLAAHGPRWRRVIAGRAAGGDHRSGGARRRGLRLLRHAGAVPGDQHADLGLRPGVRRRGGGAATRGACGTCCRRRPTR